MWKVTVINAAQSKNFAATFETETQADSWILQHEGKSTWGKPDRWLRFDSVDLEGNLFVGTPDPGHTDSRTYEIPTGYVENSDNPGQEPPDMIVDTTVTAIEYFYPKEWSVTKEDVTEKFEIEAGLLERAKKREYGQKVLDLMSYRSSLKNLTNVQSELLLNTYSTITQLLLVGDLSTARALIAAATPDGTIVTSDDQTTLLNFIDEYGT